MSQGLSFVSCSYFYGSVEGSSLDHSVRVAVEGLHSLSKVMVICAKNTEMWVLARLAGRFKLFSLRTLPQRQPHTPEP